MREYTITLYDLSKILVMQNYGKIENPLLGYVGETEPTELTIFLPSYYEGSFYVDHTVSGEWVEDETAYTDTEITYVPDFTLSAGDVYFRIRIEDSGTINYSDPIKFVVRNA